MSKELRLCKDQSCPKCGYCETTLVVDEETMQPLRFKCSSPRCDWTEDVPVKAVQS